MDSYEDVAGSRMREGKAETYGSLAGLKAFDSLAGLTIADGRLERALRGEEFLLFDGGMGTMLQASGMANLGSLPDLLSLTHPAEVSAIHAAYVAAGSVIVTTNTFSSNRKKLAGQVTVDEVYRAAVSCARAAGACYVAGDIGPTGSLLEPMGSMSFQEAYDLFAEQVLAADAAGVDLILIETFSDLLEAKAALLAARENCNLPVLVTMTFEEDGRTFLGTPPEVAASTLSAMGAHAVGTNCSLGPAEMVDIVRRIAAYSRVPLIVQPNAGLPHIQEGDTIFDITAKEFCDALEDIVEAGATFLGGCCGTTPEFIAGIKELAGRIGTPAERSQSCGFALSSAQDLVELAQGSFDVAIIGERINPTGKPKLKAALREGNLDYLVGEAVSQQRFGAQILDVNVGLPELDEPAVLEAAVRKLQETCTLPLVIDSSDPVAIEQAVRIYAGRPLINSVNGKRESLEAILPIAKRYGACVIGLTLDEDGIPSSAEGRFAIAERIVREAAAWGIPPQDIVIDCLTMAVSTNQDEAREILRAIKMVKERLGVRTALGVSNISFGLPQRSLMNSTFLAAAFGAGLDLPIVNPNDARYRDVISSYRVLCGQDRNAAAYIADRQANADPYEAAREGGAVSKASEAPSALLDGLDVPATISDAEELVRTLQTYILTGRREPVPEVIRLLVENHDALDLVNDVLMPALDEVGMRFDTGTFFLPQLMASAEAVKAGFDVLKESLGDASLRRDGQVLAIATVKGDIHDIGKNIVGMLLENYGFQVMDLGRDVSPEAILEAVLEHDIRLVGLSALMTTTVRAMEETIALLKEKAPDAKVMVGGAVLTPEYAQAMGADFYAKDAAESARIAERFFA